MVSIPSVPDARRLRAPHRTEWRDHLGDRLRIDACNCTRGVRSPRLDAIDLRFRHAPSAPELCRRHGRLRFYRTCAASAAVMELGLRSRTAAHCAHALPHTGGSYDCTFPAFIGLVALADRSGRPTFLTRSPFPALGD